MAFRITTRQARAGDRAGTVYELADDAGACRAEVWPFMGFNCLRWQVRTPDGRLGDVLYAAPDWEDNPVPTRSGHPVLFPFPNRLREGRFTFEGRTYQLPLTESSGRHAIHGFTPRNPWRVVRTEATDDEAAITGRFRLSEELPAARDLWPADCSLTLTYRLSPVSLRVEAVVENHGPGAMPFGLGYHPYFCIPTEPGAPADEMLLYCPAGTMWEAEGGLPTGRQIPVPPERDFGTTRPVGDASLDCLYGSLRPADPMSPGGLPCVAQLRHPASPGVLNVLADPAFRELLVFTPPHRRAVAVEPYTCASDAANLAARGVDAGWRVLAPSARWAAAVEYVWDALPL